MPFIGNQLSTSFQNVETQTITGDGSTSYTLNNAVADGKDLLVYINNVKQEEGSGKSYTATRTTITFTEAVASTDSCYVVFIGQAVGTVTPKDGSIVSSMLADANLEMPNTLDLNGKELILDADADTSITADTDDRVDIKIAGTDTVHVNSSGIGIKTTSGSSFTQNASSDLVIGAGSGNSGMTLFSGTSSQGAISFADGTASDNTQYRGYINYAHNLDALLFGVSGAEKVRIDADGNVGIGDTSPESNTNYIALTVTSTSGTGGGQVYVQSSSVNSVFGADNSGSDPKSILQTVTNHPLQLGTNNTQQMRIDTSGNVTKPNQPSFLVYKNPNQNNMATDTTVTVTFENEVFDVGTNFASNTFTAPVTGKYLLGTTLILGQPSTAAAYVSVIIVTSNRNYTATLNDYDAFDSTAVYYSAGRTFVCDMDAGDTAFVGVYQGGGSATTDIYASTTGSIFFGHLLG